MSHQPERYGRGDEPLLPFGGVFANTGNTQPYKYNGKEFDGKKGVNLYDYGARHYDAGIGAAYDS